MVQRPLNRALPRLHHVNTADTAKRQGRAPKRRGRPRKLNRAGSDTRKRLLHASFDAFVEHGFESATIERIARRAGLTKTAIYNHFRGKDDLMLQSAQFALETAMSQVLASLPASRVGGPAPYVRAYMAPEFSRTRRLLGESTSRQCDTLVCAKCSPIGIGNRRTSLQREEKDAFQ